MSNTLPATEGGLRSKRILGLGLISGLLYVAMYAAQRAIHGGPNTGVFQAGLALYPIITLGVFVAYISVLALCKRPLSRSERRVAFGLPVLFSLLWLPVAPVFSSDVFAYIVHGYVRVESGANPYFVHSSAVAATPLGAQLVPYGWRPVQPATPYGPVITHIETAIVRLTDADVRLSMLLFKLL